MKKLIALFLVSVMALGLLAGCASSSTVDDNSGSSKKQLIMATNAAFPPYEYMEGGKIVGIDAEIAAAVAKKLGMELVIEASSEHGLRSCYGRLERCKHDRPVPLGSIRQDFGELQQRH